MPGKATQGGKCQQPAPQTLTPDTGRARLTDHLIGLDPG